MFCPGKHTFCRINEVSAAFIRGELSLPDERGWERVSSGENSVCRMNVAGNAFHPVKNVSAGQRKK